MYQFLIYFLINFLLFVNCYDYEFIDIKLHDGSLVSGRQERDRDGEIYYSFKGIPYAKPPIGARRFQLSEPNDPWNGTLEAYEEPPSCPQGNTYKNESEDCLYINVYIPKISEPKFKSVNLKKPVLVHIIGGGFIEGTSSSELLGPEYLVAHQIILVTFNYRIGILGFLQLHDPELNIPGNNGLKDQVLALKWVQKNIESFGGDKNQVTISGDSTGGTCVHLHMLSPLSRGLFQASIMQSVTALYMNRTVNNTKYAEELNKNLQWPLENEKDAFKIINASTALQIDNVLKHMSYRGYDIISYTIEDKNAPYTFINELPEVLIQKHKFYDVPTMFGYSNEEALMYFDHFDNRTLESWFPEGDWSMSKIIGRQLTDRRVKMEQIQKILDFYFNTKQSKKLPKIYNFFHMFMDLYFFMRIVDTAYLQSIYSKEPNYMYRFSLDTKLNLMKRNMNITYPGASHSDEMGYLFKQNSLEQPDVEPGSKEQQGIEITTGLWANFVKTHNPNYPKKIEGLQKWQPINRNSFNNLDINLKLTTLPDFVERERINFWFRLRAENAAEIKYLKKHKFQKLPKVSKFSKVDREVYLDENGIIHFSSEELQEMEIENYTVDISKFIPEQTDLDSNNMNSEKNNTDSERNDIDSEMINTDSEKNDIDSDFNNTFIENKEQKLIKKTELKNNSTYHPWEHKKRKHPGNRSRIISDWNNKNLKGNETWLENDKLNETRPKFSSRNHHTREQNIEKHYPGNKSSFIPEWNNKDSGLNKTWLENENSNLNETKLKNSSANNPWEFYGKEDYQGSSRFNAGWNNNSSESNGKNNKPKINETVSCQNISSNPKYVVCEIKKIYENEINTPNSHSVMTKEKIIQVTIPKKIYEYFQNKTETDKENIENETKSPESSLKPKKSFWAVNQGKEMKNHDFYNYIINKYNKKNRREPQDIEENDLKMFKTFISAEPIQEDNSGANGYLPIVGIVIGVCLALIVVIFVSMFVYKYFYRRFNYVEI